MSPTSPNCSLFWNRNYERSWEHWTEMKQKPWRVVTMNRDLWHSATGLLVSCFSPFLTLMKKMSLCNDRCRDISLASHDMIMTQTLTVGLSQIFYSVIFSFDVKKLQAWTRACTKCFSEFSWIIECDVYRPDNYDILNLSVVYSVQLKLTAVGQKWQHWVKKETSTMITLIALLWWDWERHTQSPATASKC